jgi:hypothetical protein
MAVSKNLNAYFVRLLLAADPAIDPMRRHDLNFEARRQGMSLAFRALSSNKKATRCALKAETYFSMLFLIYNRLIGRGMPQKTLSEEGL